MHFLVIDQRFGTPIHVFLERDPRGTAGFPPLAAREVTLEVGGPLPAGRRPAVGLDPGEPGRFREFASEAAVDRAGFALVEPRYVGENWGGYCQQFRPEGEKAGPRAARPRRLGR